MKQLNGFECLTILAIGRQQDLPLYIIIWSVANKRRYCIYFQCRLSFFSGIMNKSIQRLRMKRIKSNGIINFKQIVPRRGNYL